MSEIHEKIEAGAPEFDLDVHDMKSYYHFFVKNYMTMVHAGLSEMNYSFEGKTVYDIGVGRGRAFPIYQSLGVKKVIGFDVEEGEVAFARKKAKQFGIDLEIRMNHDNEALKKVESNSCDIVSLMYVLCFVPASIKKEMIDQAKRILKPGGVIVILDVPDGSIMSRLNRLSHMGRTFSSAEEWKALLYPLKLTALKHSNYWYFINAPMNLLGKCFGVSAYRSLDRLAKKLGAAPSTSLMIFQ